MEAERREPREGAGHFRQASADVLSYLAEHAPMGFWAVTRVENGRQTYLLVQDRAYGLVEGGSHGWDESFCIHMTAGRAPAVAPDVEHVPAYAGSPVRQRLAIGAYAGAAIADADGDLFGAICGLDPERQGPELAELEPLLVLLSRLLTTALRADRMQEEATHRLLQAELAADVDALTGVYSRRAWERLLDEADEVFGRRADPTAVVVVDLDGLKATNDRDGHAAGDALLVRAATALREAVRGTDPVARLGGDEFGVLLGDCTADAAVERAAVLRRSLAEAGVQASVGVAAAVLPRGIEAAVADADRAMYEEKRRRRSDRSA